MKLTYEQICGITYGAAYVEQQDDEIHFHRFTKAQEDAYLAYREDFYRKAKGTAGIRLEFTTNSRHLSLEAASKHVSSSRPFFSFSILVNGTMLDLLGSKSESNQNVSGSYTLPEGEKRVCIYFPWSHCGILYALTLDDGATVTPVSKARRILQFGDSITHGYDAWHPHGSYASQIADAFDADARNKAIGGEIFFPTLSALRDDDFEPEWITVAYGINDWSRCPLEQFDRDSRAFYENLCKSYPNARIFALSPIFFQKAYHDTEHPWSVSHVLEQLRAIAADFPQITVIEGVDLVPHDLSLFSDGLHPNDEGFAHYGSNLIAKLNALLHEEE